MRTGIGIGMWVGLFALVVSGAAVADEGMMGAESVVVRTARDARTPSHYFVIDPVAHRIAVYRLEFARGEQGFVLLAARSYAWDLRLVDFPRQADELRVRPVDGRWSVLQIKEVWLEIRRGEIEEDLGSGPNRLRGRVLREAVEARLAEESRGIAASNAASTVAMASWELRDGQDRPRLYLYDERHGKQLVFEYDAGHLDLLSVRDVVRDLELVDGTNHEVFNLREAFRTHEEQEALLERQRAAAGIEEPEEEEAPADPEVPEPEGGQDEGGDSRRE